MPYVIAFEITHDASLWWWPWVFGTLIFGLFATIFMLLTRDLGFVSRGVKLIVILFACLWMALVVYKLKDRGHYIEAYRSGKYAVVEGTVEHYSWKGKTECFDLRGVEFCRGTGNPEQLGWPIGLTREGLPVRVAYANEEHRKILRLEIGRSSR